MDIPKSFRFNVVILPTGKMSASGTTFQLSATRSDGGLRLVSPHWQEAEVRSVLARTGLSNLQVEELFRGNRMAFGPRDARKLWFTEEQLLSVGLTPVLTVDEADVTATDDQSLAVASAAGSLAANLAARAG